MEVRAMASTTKWAGSITGIKATPCHTGVEGAVGGRAGGRRGGWFRGDGFSGMARGS